MMRSLFSGVSGLKVHQTKMDVIGNNIANVNTIGFKSSSVTFSDVFYQTTQHASGPNTETGMTGRNAMQIGLGSNVASITAAMTVSGASQRTDNPFDVMIEGDSFFIVNSGGSNYFTKSGSFNIDAAGTLCTAYGASVMGWQVDPDDETKIIQDAVSPLKIMKAENLFANPEATTEAYVTGNIDSKDTQVAYDAKGKIVNVSFYDKRGHSYTADLVVKQTEDSTSTYAVSVKDIKDENGQSIFVVKTTDEDGTVTYGASEITGINFGGQSLTVGEINTEDGTFEIDSTGAPTISFNAATGEFIGYNDLATGEDALKGLVLDIDGDATEESTFSDVNIDFSSVTMYSTSGSSYLEATKGSLDGLGAGKQVGNLTGVSIDAAGKIYGTYDNGDSRLLGQIAVASFANPAGLEAVGNSMFAETKNSGEFDGKGQDVTQGGGSFSTGVLEMSNVDLSQEFTQMITTQRGFQANSRIITTSDTLLEELINLKR